MFLAEKSWFLFLSLQCEYYKNSLFRWLNFFFKRLIYMWHKGITRKSKVQVSSSYFYLNSNWLILIDAINSRGHAKKIKPNDLFAVT